MDHERTIEGVFFHGKQLDRAPAFAQGLILPPESGIDYTEHAQCRTVIWFSLDDFLLLRARSSKSQLRLLLVVCHTRDNAFHERTREMNCIGAERAFVGRGQGLSCGSGVAFDKCAKQPQRDDLRHGSRVCRPDFVNQLMQRSGISFPIQFHACALCLYLNIIWLDSQYAIELRFLLSITPERCVTISDVVEGGDVARVEFKCALEISSGIFPAPLTPLDETRYSKYPRIIWQRLASNFQFSQSALVIEVPIVKVIRSRPVCFAGIWTDAKCFLNGCFRCRQPPGSMVIAKEVKLVMMHGELAIRFEKRRIARHSLV